MDRMNRQGSQQGGSSSQGGNVQISQSRQILDHESLSCLLLLLFVEENRLNTNWLHRVFRNLCYHPATREWFVTTLTSILKRAGETKTKMPPTTESTPMELTPASPTPGSGSKLQKQFPKKLTPTSPGADIIATAHRNMSWMSIRLDGALGSRASIFQVRTIYITCFGTPSAMQTNDGYMNPDCSTTGMG